LNDLVPPTGLEPVRCCHRGILSAYYRCSDGGFAGLLLVVDALQNGVTMRMFRDLPDADWICQILRQKLISS